VMLLLVGPSLAEIAHELAAASTPPLRTAVRSPARYAAGTTQTALVRQAAFAPVIDVLMRAREKLPVDACITSAIPEQTMFYARRPGRDLARAVRRPEQLLRECPYVLMLAFRSFPDNGVPPMFPYQRLRSNLQILDVAESDLGNGKRVVRALLAHYRAPFEP